MLIATEVLLPLGLFSERIALIYILHKIFSDLHFKFNAMSLCPGDLYVLTLKYFFWSVFQNMGLSQFIELSFISGHLGYSQCPALKVVENL